MTWRVLVLSWWYWSPERDNPILDNVQSMAVQHWFHPLKLHETIRHDDFEQAEMAQNAPDIPVDRAHLFQHVV